MKKKFTSFYYSLCFQLGAAQCLVCGQLDINKQLFATSLERWPPKKWAAVEKPPNNELERENDGSFAYESSPEGLYRTLPVRPDWPLVSEEFQHSHCYSCPWCCSYCLFVYVPHALQPFLIDCRFRVYCPEFFINKNIIHILIIFFSTLYFCYYFIQYIISHKTNSKNDFYQNFTY